MKITDEHIKVAGKVCHFMMSLYEVDKERYEEAIKHELPHGDLAYGQAIYDWQKKGCPKNAFFSYAEGQRECKLLIAFRKEISAKFGLEICTREEAKAKELLLRKTKTVKVVDWSLN